MDIFAAIAERKISEAVRRGDLDNLSLRGQPIARDDSADVPEELRMGYKILKNAGILPEELQLSREILTLRNLLDCCRDRDEEKELRRKLNLRQLHYDILMEKRSPSASFRHYEDRIREKLGL